MSAPAFAEISHVFVGGAGGGELHIGAEDGTKGKVAYLGVVGGVLKAEVLEIDFSNQAQWAEFAGLYQRARAASARGADVHDVGVIKRGPHDTVLQLDVQSDGSVKFLFFGGDDHGPYILKAYLFEKELVECDNVVAQIGDFFK